MAVRIRLTRQGMKKKPFYRIVVADSQSPRDGKFLAVVGTYDPKGKDEKVTINKEKIESWLKKGATASDTVRTIFARAGVTV